MAQFYEVLGLDAPPKDRRDVKKAYSKKLKVTRPEDDPDGFMRLRDAHDYALKWLSWQPKAEPISDDDTPEPDNKDDDMDDAAINESLNVSLNVSLGTDTITVAENSPTAYSIGLSPSLDAPPPDLVEENSTGYNIGATPNLEAPPQTHIEPAPPPLDDDIIALLQSEETRNNREGWNSLFRKARELNIDDYVDFENLLFHRILEFHGFYEDNNDYFETPEKMKKLISRSITASLFKTMHWDEVTHFDPQKKYRIEWLEKRMGLRKPNISKYVQGPQTPENVPQNLARWFWPALALIFLLAIISDLIAG